MIRNIVQDIKTFHQCIFHICLNRQYKCHKEDCMGRISCTLCQELYHLTNSLFHKHTFVAHRLGRRLRQDSHLVCTQCSLVLSVRCNEDISNDNHLSSSFPMMCLCSWRNMFDHLLCWEEQLNSTHILWLTRTLNIVCLLKAKPHQLLTRHDHWEFNDKCQVSNPIELKFIWCIHKIFNQLLLNNFYLLEKLVHCRCFQKVSKDQFPNHQFKCKLLSCLKDFLFNKLLK